MKFNIESSPPEIWIMIRFHNGSGSPSLVRISIRRRNAIAGITTISKLGLVIT